MPTTQRSLYRIVPLLLMGILVPLAAAQDRAGQGLTREQMWRAPTDEEWARPCLITWQRSWEDALAVAQETGKPILVCVNMDGEIASEHYAGVRYRQPEIAALYEPYVCVIASVYRHTPRDHDDQGRRILCPRFGSVTCGEHISIEPGLFEQFFEDQRVAPRHIGVELDNQEMYDVFYAYDTDTIFNALREGIAERDAPPPTPGRGDRSLLERVASADILDRVAVEESYQEGDAGVRRVLLETTVAQGKQVSLELLRLALFGSDPELARMARRALANSDTQGTVDLLFETLGQPLEGGEREALVSALLALGERSPRAAALGAVYRGLTTDSEVVDVARWTEALAEAGESATAPERGALEARLDAAIQATQADPADGQASLELAEAALALAIDPGTTEVGIGGERRRARFAEFLLKDARRAGLEAERLGVAGWRVDAVLALAAHYLGEGEEASTRVEQAARALPAGERSWNAMATLALFAEARREAIRRSANRRKIWPAEWLSDLDDAYEVLAAHPWGQDGQAVAHYDFLRRLGARGPAARVLDAALMRFPESWEVHQRLRDQVLAQRGFRALGGLEAVYETMLAREDASPNLEWFAGYASLVVAEFHRRARQPEQALGAYGRGITHFELAATARPETRESADHYVAVALAGRARIALEAGDYPGALAELLASFERKEEAAAALDGLGISAVATARTLEERLKEAGQAELLAELQAAIEELDPELLRLPAFEAQGPPPDRRGQGGRRGRPGRQGR